jgi:RES domain
MSPLAEPPADLGGFPEKRIEVRGELVRIHRVGHDPWFFDSSPHGRFNLTDVDDHGTCYFAEEPLGAFVETFRDFALIDEEMVAERLLYCFALRNPLHLADCTSREVLKYGITAEIGSSEDYDRTQAWAMRLFDAGFGGVRYWVRHDPAQELAGVAVFGSNRLTGASESDIPIPDDLREAAQREFGFAIWPAPAT